MLLLQHINDTLIRYPVDTYLFSRHYLEGNLKTDKNAQYTAHTLLITLIFTEKQYLL